MWSVGKKFPRKCFRIYFQLAEELSAVGLEPQNKGEPYLYQPEGEGRRDTEVNRINDSKLFEIFLSRHSLPSGNTNSRPIATDISVQQWLLQRKSNYTALVWRQSGPASSQSPISSW